MIEHIGQGGGNCPPLFESEMMPLILEWGGGGLGTLAIAPPLPLPPAVSFGGEGLVARTRPPRSSCPPPLRDAEGHDGGHEGGWQE